MRKLVIPILLVAATVSTYTHHHLVRDYQSGQVIGDDPDQRIRQEIQRDGSSSWD